MYIRCLFCTADLGRNEAVEAFPVGRRLAFDAAKGRLWVVCPRCARWNLTPLEERWEAMEQGERLYRAARRRVSTDNVGLARAADGTDLVRVGAALRPEFAAWRYGRQFAIRRTRFAGVAAVGLTVGTAGAVGALALPAAAAALPVGGGMLGTVLAAFAARVVYDKLVGRVAGALDVALATDADRVVAWLPKRGDGARTPVTFRHLADTRLGWAGGDTLTVAIAHDGGRREFAGAEAKTVLTQLLPHVNRAGASAADVRHAVAAIETRGGPEAYVSATARAAQRSGQTRRATDVDFYVGAAGAAVSATGLFALHETQRVALEMALHEDAERRAMDGELAALEAAWRDAEEIAGIADSLVLPPRVERAFARLRGDPGHRGG